MKYFSMIILAAITLLACNSKTTIEEKDTRIFLRSDSINVVKLTDTLVIGSSTCRGCAYEGSTNFSIDDSTGTVKITDVITHDANPDNISGGNVSKEIVIVPLKTGHASFKFYRFWTEQRSAKDSTGGVVYEVEVIN